jgi:hypothetical protein
MDGLIGVWVRQTRDVAFEAADALDDFFYDEVYSLRPSPTLDRSWVLWVRTQEERR